MRFDLCILSNRVCSYALFTPTIQHTHPLYTVLRSSLYCVCGLIFACTPVYRLYQRRLQYTCQEKHLCTWHTMQYNTCVVRPYMAHTYTAAQTYVPPPPPHTHTLAARVWGNSAEYQLVRDWADQGGAQASRWHGVERLWEINYELWTLQFLFMILIVSTFFPLYNYSIIKFCFWIQ